MLVKIDYWAPFDINVLIGLCAMTQGNEADRLSRAAILKLRRLVFVHLLFVVVFAAGILLLALLGLIAALTGVDSLFTVGLAFFGLGVASFFFAPPVVSFLYARKLNAWKAFWFATAAGIPLSLGGALFGSVMLAMLGRVSDIDPGNPVENVVFVFGIALLLLPNLVAPLVSYLLLRRRILSIAMSDDS